MGGSGELLIYTARPGFWDTLTNAWFNSQPGAILVLDRTLRGPYPNLVTDVTQEVWFQQTDTNILDVKLYFGNPLPTQLYWSGLDGATVLRVYYGEYFCCCPFSSISLSDILSW